MRKITKKEHADWIDGGERTASSDGHYHIDGNKIYVDSNFVNSSQNLISGSKLEHMGFGEFYLDTPGGRIDFDRMRGKDFDGQSGRSHLLTDEVGGKLAKKLVKKMAQSGRAIEASRSLEALTDWVDDDIEESVKHLTQADKLISNIARNTGGKGIKKLSLSLKGLISDLNKIDSEDLED